METVVGRLLDFCICQQTFKVDSLRPVRAHHQYTVYHRIGLREVKQVV